MTNIGELLYDRPISDPYLSWDVRYPIEQWVSNVLNYRYVLRLFDRKFLTLS